MEYLYIKSLHIIFVVTWFSGMFYLCRLFIYQREAHDKNEIERNILLDQFRIMTRRLLYGITVPSVILTWIFGLWLLRFYHPMPQWLYIKLIMVLLLTIYHISLHKLYHLHKNNIFRYSSFKLRLWNEVPTVFLFGIVFLVVVKKNVSVLYAIGLIALIILLYVATVFYKRRRLHSSD